MKALFLPGIGASHREFPEYSRVFDELIIIRYQGCFTLDDHLNRIDEYVNQYEINREEYILIGHSMGANLVYHYVTHRKLEYLKSYSMVGGGPRFYPLNTWNTIFSLPNFGIALVLFFIALGAPFLFFAYGWNGMYQRINVIDMFKREGIGNIKRIYNNTLVPLLEDPICDESEIPSQIIRLPNDILFPQKAMEETYLLKKEIEEYLIARDLIHFSHHLDILVVGHIFNFLKSKQISDFNKKTLPFDVDYALTHPESIPVEIESYEIPRLPVAIVLLIIIINGTKSTFPDLIFSIFMEDLQNSIVSLFNFNILSIYQLIGMIFGLVISLYLYHWLINPKLPKRLQSKFSDYPYVSIIVPMRNEARNIKNCLVSLLNLQYPNYEIIISDGQSEDASIKIAKQTIEEHNKMGIDVLVIEEEQLPQGWVGKSWGCWNSVKYAKGQYYLFTDADTDHSKDSLRKAMKIIHANNLSGLSIIGKFKTKSFWEIAILPFFKSLLFIIFGGRFSNSRGRTLAIGQYILVNSEIYNKFGGHKSIKTEIAEDIHLAEQIRSNGSFAAFNDNSIYSVRMYQSLSEISEGLQRNATESVGNSLIISIIASLGLIIWRLLPLILIPLIYSSLNPLSAFLSLSYLLFVILLFYIDTKINDDPWYYTFVFPIGLIVLVWFLINSSLKKSTDKTRTWKGRKYDF